jgi:hypothetical protein
LRYARRDYRRVAADCNKAADAKGHDRLVATVFHIIRLLSVVDNVDPRLSLTNQQDIAVVQFCMRQLAKSSADHNNHAAQAAIKLERR